MEYIWSLYKVKSAPVATIDLSDALNVEQAEKSRNALSCPYRSNNSNKGHHIHT